MDVRGRPRGTMDVRGRRRGTMDVRGGIASVIVRSAPYREYLHLIRTDEGWKIADALWLPQ